MVPLVLNANPKVSGSSLFDVPAERSVTSAEFTLPAAGQVRAMGPHLHDHAVEIRLEEVATGEVIVRLETDRDAEGRLVAIEQARFGFGLGALRLDADRRYRVVGVYDNPTGKTIPNGAMAYMAGIFIPDDPNDWPELDLDDPVYRNDITRMVGGIEPAHEHSEYADR